MKIKDFISVSPESLTQMSKADLQKLSASGGKIANRRITSLLTVGGQFSPAYTELPEKVKRQQKYTTPRSLTKNQLISQIQSQQRFIKSKTSTRAGWTKTQLEIEKRYYKSGRKVQPGKNYRYTLRGEAIPGRKPKAGEQTFTRRQIDRFWEIFHKAQQAHPELFVSKYDKQEAFDRIAAIFKESPNIGVDRGLQILNERINEEYEESQKQSAETAQGIRRGEHFTF